MPSKTPFGERVLRVRCRWDAEPRIALAADSAVRALQASGIRAVFDQVPPDYALDLVTVQWTDDAEESRFVMLFAGHDLKDPTALRMAEAFGYAFRGAREFMASYERLNADLEAELQAVGDDVGGEGQSRPN